MDIIVEKGCGIDVHKETPAACIVGTEILKIRTYKDRKHHLQRQRHFQGSRQGGIPLQKRYSCRRPKVLPQENRRNTLCLDVGWVLALERT